MSVVSTTAGVLFTTGTVRTCVFNDVANISDLKKQIEAARDLKYSLLAVGTTDGKDALIDAALIENIIVVSYNVPPTE